MEGMRASLVVCWRPESVLEDRSYDLFTVRLGYMPVMFNVFSGFDWFHGEPLSDLDMIHLSVDRVDKGP